MVARKNMKIPSDAEWLICISRCNTKRNIARKIIKFVSDYEQICERLYMIDW